MATLVLIPGAGSDSWYWHLVVPRLEAMGHEVVAVDLPCDDDTADLDTYADTVVSAIGDRPGDQVVLVAQSLGGFTAPLVAARRPVALIVLVAAMVPAPGERFDDWGANTGAGAARRAQAERDGRDPDEFDEVAIFLHDVPADVAAESAHHVRDQSMTPFERPWPLAAWPDVPTRFLLCRDDRMFPAEFQRRVARERLGLVADEMEGGHLPALAHPDVLADRLDAYAREELAERPASRPTVTPG
jgi:pimeloyl-ACP methyl ester carboxylesterase